MKKFMLLEDQETRHELHTSDRASYPLSFVRTEETSVVTLLNHNIGDAWSVVLLQADTGLPDGY